MSLRTVLLLAAIAVMTDCQRSQCEEARFDWHVLPNSVLYDAKKHEYDTENLHSPPRSIVFSVASHRRIPATYEWTFEEIGGTQRHTHKTIRRRIAASGVPVYSPEPPPFYGLYGFQPGKASDVPIEPVPALSASKPYRVTLRIKTSGVEETTSAIVDPRDFLVVSIGDSYASGQGVPSGRGKSSEKVAGLGVNRLPELLIADLSRQANPTRQFQMETKPVWLEPLAFRSRRSAPSRAAKELVNSHPHSSVTFLSFASSGATIEKGLIGPQGIFTKISAGGNVRDKRGNLGQLDQVVKATGTRQIDALVISIGANDVGFAKVLAESIRGDLLRTQTHSDAINSANQFGNKLTDLAKAIKTKFALQPRHIYFVEYPTEVFGEINDRRLNTLPLVTVCGRISDEEAVEIHKIGRVLNENLRFQPKPRDSTSQSEGRPSRTARPQDAARSILRDSRVHTIGDIADRFRNHGYCAKESYFVQIDESCAQQGNILGAFHPNSTGIRLVADRIAEELYTGLIGAEKQRQYLQATQESLTKQQRLIALRMDLVNPATSVEALVNQHRWQRKPADINQAIAEIERRHTTKSRKRIRFLSQNTYLINAVDGGPIDLGSAFIKKESAPHKRIRANFMSPVFARNFDFIAACEVFQEREKQNLEAAFRPTTFFSNQLFGNRKKLGSKIGGSGLLAISKIPVSGEYKFHEFKAETGIDAQAAKGVLRTEVEVGLSKGNVEIYQTHLQAGDGSTRLEQVEELCKFFKNTHEAKNVAIICGDFNINSLKNEENNDDAVLHNRMRDIGFTDFWRSDFGPGPTSNTKSLGNRVATRDIASPLFVREPASSIGTRIDYVFIQQPNAKHGIIVDYSRPRRIALEMPQLNGSLKHMSDHLGLATDLYVVEAN
ncbi:hypothetical protein OAH18_01250 [bacterium]|nr:hypothetical protein [bacterium]